MTSHESLKFSVITPSFNQGNFIEQTIQSVLNQNYSNFEHLVIDGGSTDQTLTILNNHPHLKWVSEKDKGQSNALNKGFMMATGDIIAWINSDDWYEPGAFKAVADFFHRNPAKNVIMGDCNLINESEELFDKVTNKERGYSLIRKYWVGRSIPTQPAIFFRRQLLQECGLIEENLHLAMDYDLWLRFARKNRFYHLNCTVANYRFHADAKGGSRDWSKFIPEWKAVYKKNVPAYFQALDMLIKFFTIKK